MVDPDSNFPAERGYRIPGERSRGQDIFTSTNEDGSLLFDIRSFEKHSNPSELESSYRSLSKEEIVQFEQVRSDLWGMQELENQAGAALFTESLHVTGEESVRMMKRATQVTENAAERWNDKELLKGFMDSTESLEGNEKLRNLIYSF